MDKKSWDEKKSYAGNHYMYIVECRRSMFEPLGAYTKQTPYSLAISCIKTSIEEGTSSSLFGIILLGSKKSLNSSNYNNVLIFQPLQKPSKESILAIEDELVKLSEDEFESKYGFSDEYSYGEAFWTSSNMFWDKRPRLRIKGESKKQLLIFTNNDNPHSGNESTKTFTISRAQDLHCMDVNIVVIPLLRNDVTFNFNEYYKYIVYDPNTYRRDLNISLESLMKQTKLQDHTVRSLATLPFIFGEKIKIMVKLYGLARETKKPLSVLLDEKTNQILERDVKIMDAETGEVILKENVKKQLAFGDEKIFFETHEVLDLKGSERNSLTLLGFKPRSNIKIYYQKRPPYFMYPDKSEKKCTMRLFYALLLNCRKKSVVAICKLLFRNSTYLVALIPDGDETSKLSGVRGFHVQHLPFAEDFRSLKEPDGNEIHVRGELVGKAKEIIKLCHAPFNPKNIQNPVLQKINSHLEALATKQSKTYEIQEYSVMKSEPVNEKLSVVIREFHKILGFDTTQNTNAIQSFNCPDKETLCKMATDRTLGKLTVAELKVCFKKLGICCKVTKKADIIEEINRYFKLF